MKNINIHLCTGLVCVFTPRASEELHHITNQQSQMLGYRKLPERESCLVASLAAFTAPPSPVGRTADYFSGF